MVSRELQVESGIATRCEISTASGILRGGMEDQRPSANILTPIASSQSSTASTLVEAAEPASAGLTRSPTLTNIPLSDIDFNLADRKQFPLARQNAFVHHP